MDEAGGKAKNGGFVQKHEVPSARQVIYEDRWTNKKRFIGVDQKVASVRDMIEPESEYEMTTMMQGMATEKAIHGADEVVGGVGLAMGD